MHAWLPLGIFACAVPYTNLPLPGFVLGSPEFNSSTDARLLISVTIFYTLAFSQRLFIPKWFKNLFICTFVSDSKLFVKGPV